MSIAHASVCALRSCLVQAVRGADALAQRLFQRAEQSLEQALSSGFSPAQRDVLGVALQHLRQQRDYLRDCYPQNLLEAMVLSARQPFSFTAQSFDATAMEPVGQQPRMQQKLLQLAAAQVELALADLDALMSGAQGLDWVQPECNPLRPDNYARALEQSLMAVQPTLDVAECWREFMGPQLGALLVSEYARSAKLLRQQGVAPARYGEALDARARQPQYLLMLRLLQELASDQRWIGDNHCTVPQTLTDSMLAGLPMEAGPASALVADTDSALQTGWTSYSASALQTSSLPRVGSGVGGGLAQARTLQRMMAHMTGDSRLQPAVRKLLHQLEPALLSLVEKDMDFLQDQQHPARQLLDELTARSLWFVSESAPGFAHFIEVAQAAADRLIRLSQTDAQAFALALQYAREQWPPQGDASPADAPGQDEIQPDIRHIAQTIRNLPDTQGAPEDILDFVTGPWAGVISQARQRSGAAGESDPGGYLALVPSLLWSVSVQAAQDASRLAALAPQLQRCLARGLREVGRTETEIAALAAHIASLQQRALASAPPTETPVETPTAQADDDWPLGTWVELRNERQQLRTRLTWVSPRQSLFLFTAQDGSTQSMTRRMRDKLLANAQLRRVD